MAGGVGGKDPPRSSGRTCGLGKPLVDPPESPVKALSGSNEGKKRPTTSDMFQTVSKKKASNKGTNPTESGNRRDDRRYQEAKEELQEEKEKTKTLLNSLANMSSVQQSLQEGKDRLEAKVEELRKVRNIILHGSPVGLEVRCSEVPWGEVRSVSSWCKTDAVSKPTTDRRSRTSRNPTRCSSNA